MNFRNPTRRRDIEPSSFFVSMRMHSRLFLPLLLLALFSTSFIASASAVEESLEPRLFLPLLLLALFSTSFIASASAVEESLELSKNVKNTTVFQEHDADDFISRTKVDKLHHQNTYLHNNNNNNKNNNSITRSLQTDPMQGTCTSSTLGAGQQRPAGSYLCYPPPDSSNTNNFNTDPTYKFGIDTNNRLSYYVNNILVWQATPAPDGETQSSTACIVFGTCDPDFQFFRLQNGGSLAGYSATDNNRMKIWDSHDETYHEEDGNGGTRA
eukprot:CAMPEP_0171387044 /NCGR_PEP_ID=MMETSP0879-20121228/39798_1 /TAXON_ID=67004 /ORGANISM="Thalassiosira weissflogii, Strain CCMP1336" /LENGTH=268 /DNA_ID=CAMNT_0011899365 /DNA_START=182 /DNA_END=985 /DNA_ORIENTATION=-